MEKTFNGKIYPMFDVDFEGNVILKYCDKNMAVLGIRDLKGRLIPSSQFAYDSIDFLEEIDNSYKDKLPSLEELDQKLDKVSKTLGITKRDVLAMSQAQLDVAIDEKDISPSSSPEDKKNKKTITVKEDDKELQEDEQNREQNKDALENIQAKQEINPDRKIDDRYTLADVLGVPAGSKLLAVDTSRIENSKNTTRFSLVAEFPDGTIREIDSLSQVGGKDSDKNDYEANRDGSSVEKQNIKSSYAINSPIIQNGILTVRYGQMGNIEVGYGQMDKTSHRDIFTQRLETDELYPTTARVREEFSKDKWELNITEKIDEIKEHEEHGCDMTLDDADGNPYTGHDHSEEVVERIIKDDEVGEKINGAFTKNEIKERFEAIQKNYPNKTFDELVEITKEELGTDADHMHSIEHRQ